MVGIVGNLAYQVEESTLTAMLGHQEGSKECTRQKLNQMRVDLSWNESSAIERILIERIVATWLSLHCAELSLINWKGGTIVEAEYNQSRIDRAQRRHLAAVKMLATVRKMALPLLVDFKASINVTQTKTEEAKSKFENRLATLNSNN